MTRLLPVLAMLLTVGCVTKEQTKIEPAKSGERSTVIGGVLDRADQSVCEQYLAQLNQAVMMYRSDNEVNPPDLATVIKLSGVPESELKNCSYAYDAGTGVVSLVK